MPVSLPTVIKYTFFIVLLIDLVCIFLELPYRNYSKPLVMISLTSYLLSTLGKSWTNHLIMLAACLFALIGDIFLLKSNQESFLMGLGSFLVMHLCYIFIFFRQKAIGVHKHVSKIIGVFLLIGLATVLLWSRAGNLKIPVVIYTIVIGGTLLTSLMRWKTKGYYQVICGAVLFVISDALIATQEFVYRFDYLGFFIMLTYGVAQFLIIDGYLKAKL